MSERMLARLAIGLLIGLAVALLRVAMAFYASPRFTRITKTLATIGIILALYAGFTLYPQESAFYKAKREAATEPYGLCAFKDKYPSSHRLSEVDDLLWQSSYGPKGGFALYLYEKNFPSGRHKEELKQRLAKKKQDDLTALRTRPEIRMARDFLSTYKDAPEAAEAREILFAELERTSAGNPESPSPALLHQLARRSESSRVTYSVEVAEDTDCPNSGGVKSAIEAQLRAALEEFQLQAQPAEGPAAIRARAACLVEKASSYGEGLAHSEIIGVAIELYLPGESKPAWSGTIAARSPVKVSGLGKDVEHNQGVVTARTVDALRDSLKPLFRYWE